LRAREIVKAVRFALSDAAFRRQLAACVSPYGDGHTAEHTIDVLSRLKLDAALTPNGGSRRARS